MGFEATALSGFGVLFDVLFCGGHDALLRIVDLRGTIGRKPCPLSCQISRAFMALAWFLCVVATSDRGTEKPVPWETGTTARQQKSASTSCRVVPRSPFRPRDHHALPAVD